MAARRKRNATVPRSARLGRLGRLGHWKEDGGPKQRYPSEAEANKAALGALIQHGNDLSVYRCELCGGWHLGRSSPTQR